MSSKLETYLRSGYSALYAVTQEEERITYGLRDLCSGMGLKVWEWDPVRGLVEIRERSTKVHEQWEGKPTKMPQVALMAYNDVKVVEKEEGKKEKAGTLIQNKSVLIMKDLHLYLAKRDPEFTRLIKHAVLFGRETGRAIIVMAPMLALTPETEKEFTVVDFPLPDRPALAERAKDCCKWKGVDAPADIEAVLDAGVGLTLNEFADACSASLTDHQVIVPAVVADIKAATMRKGGLLEIIEPGVSFDQLGGLDALKTWINTRKDAHGPEALEFGLPVQKGILLFGVQGAGKSLTSRAIATELKSPLLRLDVGKLFAGIVGSSEFNARAVIAQVEAFGRCVLQIDEIDKGFGGMVGGHDGDGGTTRRVLGTFLTWMAEKKSEVFCVATANDVTKLPPELLRKGRWDEIFFLDLPTHKERCEIWRVHLLLKKLNPKEHDIEKLSDTTDGWTGAEIETLVSEGLFVGWRTRTKPTTQTLIELSQVTQPLSVTMEEAVRDLRKWAKGKARMASAQSPQVEEEEGKRSFGE